MALPEGRAGVTHVDEGMGPVHLEHLGAQVLHQHVQPVLDHLVVVARGETVHRDELGRRVVLDAVRSALRCGGEFTLQRHILRYYP